MDQPPYRTARRVFWVVANGTIHRGQRSCERLQRCWPNLILVHLPIPASWLNQIEIYFSILQRQALIPDDFSTLAAIAERILGFQQHYQALARPFEWRFTRRDLNNAADALWLRALALAGLGLDGAPELPQTHLRALEGVEWRSAA